MPRLIRVFAGRTLILLVLLCRGQISLTGNEDVGQDGMGLGWVGLRGRVGLGVGVDEGGIFVGWGGEGGDGRGGGGQVCVV